MILCKTERAQHAFPAVHAYFFVLICSFNKQYRRLAGGVVSQRIPPCLEMRPKRIPKALSD